MLRVLADGPELGLMAWEVRDRIYPEGSAMREYRPGRGEWQTGKGALGNLAAGRLLNALYRLGLATNYSLHRVGDNRWTLTYEGRRVAAAMIGEGR